MKRCLSLALPILWVGLVPSVWAAAPADIQIDQVGYLTNETKLAMVTNASATGTFYVVDASGPTTVFTGTLSSASTDTNTGLSVRTADFSTVTATGTYSLQVAGLGQSYSFSIGPNVFSNAFYESMRFYYGQRCGTAVNLAPTFPGYTHAACHTADGTYHTSSGKSGTKSATKGWHDAGDYGKYVVNSGISTGEILWTYEWYASTAGAVNLQVPESGNGTPDILNEARWNLEWMLAMQDTDGGVWHKLTTAAFDAFEMPEVDSAGTRYIIGNGTSPYKTTAATADFAAVMAIAARVYQPFDATFSAACSQAAVTAWGWIQSNPNVTFTVNPTGISTGVYGDGTVTDERLWAAAELFRTTGGAAYNTYFTSNYTGWSPTVNGNAYPQDWSNVHQLAMWTYYFSGQASANTTARNTIKTDTINAANTIVTRQNADGYRVSLRTADYVWGSNGGVANFGILLLMANAMTPTASYVQAARDDIHYLLGRNGNKISFVTRLGTTYPLNPHHRPSGSDGNALPWPGMLVGGPNSGGGDSITPTSPGTKAALCYTDQQGAYASNEEAINWNAPLVFILASTLQAAVPTSTPTNSPSATATRTPTATATRTATLTPSRTSTFSPTDTPTASASATPTRTPSSTPTSSSTATASLTPSSTPTATFLLTATQTPTSTATSSPTRTGTPTPTASPTDSVTWTPSATPTATLQFSATNTATSSPTPTPTYSGTPTVTWTATASPTGTSTASPSPTATKTATRTASATPTATFMSTATNTPTATRTWTPTGTPTPSRTATPTSTPTLTPSWTHTPSFSPTASPSASATPTLSFGNADISLPYPNPIPFNDGPIWVDLTVPGPSHLRWAVFTTAFRKIAWGGSDLSSDQTFGWDLKDRTGTPAARGLYYLRMELTGNFGKVQTIRKVLIH
ncbi:MAG TPA: glycoside hydrolase family 9 protein [bacterium]|nr:glycoside hydrolase family 9 protein [bacterium]